jgi:hypothetical protein
MPELLTRTVDLDTVDTATDETGARTITARVCRWMDPRPVRDRDGPAYVEQHAPGSLHLARAVHVRAPHLEDQEDHRGQLIGDVTDLSDGDDGPTITIRVAPTSAGVDTLRLIDTGIVRAVSMEYAPDPGGAVVDGDVITRTATTIHGVAFAFRPALDAPILTRTDPTPNGGPVPTVMPDTPTLPAPANDADEQIALLLRTEVDDLAAQVAVIAEREPTGAAGRHPATEFASLGDYALARIERAEEVPALLLRALADQITPNNPGVLPPTWLTEVFGVIDRGRPLVTAFGPRSAGTEGMDINWPYFDGDLTTLVGEQVAEKTPITSVRVDIKRGTEALRTFAGGSDISYQLIRRSSPSYRDAYMRIMSAAYSAETDAAAAVDAVAGATGVVDLAPLTATADQLRGALFAASVQVQAATGQPASFALAATDVFIRIGGLTGLWPMQYGTQNVSGTADASSLRVDVSGLAVIHDPYLAAGTLLVSNGQAAGWLEDGPFTVAAEDVERLGQNVAIWGMGAWATFLPKGVVIVKDVP